MALDKAGLKSALQSAFEDMAEQKPEGETSTVAQAATVMADAIDAYVKTALAKVFIPPGTVVTAAAPIAAPVLNPLPISLSGDPDAVGPLKGGLS
jgi:hypothetical protein